MAVPPAGTLRFIEQPAPRPGVTVPVAPGIHWLRMPLPAGLDHINLWLLEDDGGFVLVDTGEATDATREAWLALERGPLRRLPLRLIVLTHLHPDHAGLAAWLQDRFGVPLWTSRGTYEQLQLLTREPTPDELAQRRAQLVHHGLPQVTADEMLPVLEFKVYRTAVSGLPQVERFPENDDTSRWGGRDWRWLATGGHAYGHLCLHSSGPQDILICGDQVLPSLSSNVSWNPMVDDANPLGTYLADLERLSRIDRDTLTLPSHGLPFRGVTERAQELRRHHEQRLEKLLDACRTALTAVETLPFLYRRQHEGFKLYLALGEALAHLEYLAAEGRLERLEDGGVRRYLTRA